MLVLRMWTEKHGEGQKEFNWICGFGEYVWQGAKRGAVVLRYEEIRSGREECEGGTLIMISFSPNEGYQI